MKLYDLSQPLNERSSFWPYYPPFEVKYIKRKAEHGVTAQYIMTSNHRGPHLDAPRHFVTAGKTCDELPLEWLCGPGVIVDLRDEMDELAVYTPQMIEKRVAVKQGDVLLLHTGWHRYADFGATPDEERYYHYHPGAHPDLVPWLLEKQIHVWGVDCVSTDHPMNLPIGRFLGKWAQGVGRGHRASRPSRGGDRATDRGARRLARRGPPSLPRAARAPQPGHQRGRDAEPARAGRRPRAGAATRPRRAAGPAVRAPRRHQGRDSGGGAPHHVRVAALQGLRPRGRRPGGAAAARGGRRDPRQDQLPRVRGGGGHLQRGVRAPAPSLGPRG